MEDEDPWLTDGQQRVWRDWLRVSSLLPVALHLQLQDDSELSFPDFEILSEVSEAEHQRARVGDLARCLQWERSRVSHQVRRMSARGLVRREEVADDGRGAFVVLTPAGRAAIERAAPGHARTVRRLMFEPLTEQQCQAFGEALAVLVAVVREAVPGTAAGSAADAGAARRRSSGGAAGPRSD